MKWINKNIMGFSLASFLNDWCHEMTTAILPTFVATLTSASLVPTYLGLIQGLSDGASTIMKLTSGWIAQQKVSYKPFLVAGYGITGIFSGLIGIANSVWTVLIFKIVAWMARGLREPIRDMWISLIVAPVYYGRAFGFQRAWDTFGSLLGPLTAYFLLQLHFSLPTIFFISLIPGILSALPFLWISDIKTTPSQKKSIETIFSKITQLPKKFNYFLLVYFIFALGYFHQTLLIFRAQEVIGGIGKQSIIATAWSILFYTCSNITKGLAEFGIGALSDFLNRRILLAIFGFGLFSLSIIGFMFTITHFWIWPILFGLVGLSAGTVKSLGKSYIASLLPESVRGIGLGVFQTIEGIGALISSILIGFLWTATSAMMAFLFSVIMGFIGMILLLARE